MGEILAVALLSILGIVTLAASLVTLSLLAPAYTGRAAATLERSPRRTFGLGLVNLLFFVALAALLSGGGDLGILGALLLLLLSIVALIGLGGIVAVLRARLALEEQGWRATAAAALLLVLTVAAPVVGWFVLGPLLIVAAVGSGILSLLRRNEPAEKPPY